MKKIIITLLVMVLVVTSLVISGCTQPASPSNNSEPITPSQTPAEEKVIKAISMHSKDVETVRNYLEVFLNNVNTKLEGEVRIEWLGGPEVIGVMEQADAVKNGVVDMELIQGRGMASSLMPVCMAGDLSQLTGNEERESGAFEVWDEAYGEFLNSKYLGMMDNGANGFSFLFNKPVTTLDDIKGTKVRVYGMYQSIAEAFGASPVVVPLNELYTALQRNVVEGYITPIPNLFEYMLYEVTDYLVEPWFFQVTSATYMNLDVWNSLSQHAQDVINEEMVVQEEYVREVMRQDLERSYERLKDTDVIIIQLSPEDSKTLLTVTDETGWAYVFEQDNSDYSERLRPLISK
jgi:TRAP-type C4-dicarboxylate transport system substrate-binding protein